MMNEEREKKINKQPIPTKEECLAFYKELTKIADVRFVPYYKMAIKALEQEPCEEQEIYEKAYKEGYDKGWSDGNFIGASTSSWIPVSERLPEERDWYLGIFKEPDTDWINPLPFVCDYVGHETKATTKEHWILRGFTDRDAKIDYYFNLECVSWMPLPEPCKESEV